MPPPLPQQQGSRAGLITALVIAVVLLLVSVILNFYESSQLVESQQAVDKVIRKYKDVIKPDFANTDPDLANLNSVKADLKTVTFIDTSLAQTKQLAAIIQGPVETPAISAKTIVDAAKEVLADSTNKLKGQGVAVTMDSLVGAIGNLTNAVLERQAQVEAAKTALIQANAQRDAEIKKYAAALEGSQRAVEEANKKAAEAVAAQNAAEADKTSQVANAGTASAGVVETTNKSLAEKDAAIAQLNANLVKLNQVIGNLQSRLKAWRLSVTDPVIRQADARIIRVGSSNDVYIDLGAGDRLTPGLTFEIYDKTEGVPKLGDGVSPDNMPVGKASIEVTNIGQNSSRCRIIKTNPASTPLSEGDICVNLVYDRHAKYNFMVYGDFDMNGDGIVTAGEADMVRNLCRRWGGGVVTKITVDTDFLVLGREPVVPQLSTEEKTDAILVAKQDAAREALNKYEAVVNAASSLHIPIMNQNRFLYYTGYFDLVKR